MHRLYCGNKILFGVIHPEGILEVKCRSGRCGHRPGVLVFHRFDLHTGELVETKQYKDPIHGKENNASQ